MDRRRYEISEDDIRALIQLIASRQSGKPWQVEVDENYKKEYGIKDKLAPIFCSGVRKVSKSRSLAMVVNTSNRDEEKNASNSDSDSDAPLITFINSGERRSGLPPTSKKIEKKKKENQKKAKKEVKTKKEKDSSVRHNLKKFVVTGTSSPVAPSDGETIINSPFMTPQKRSEKRFISANMKLSEAWRKRDHQEFMSAAAWAAKVLSGVQIEKIDCELHRFVVRKVYDKVKDQEAMKKMPSKEARREFKEKMNEQRKDIYKKMEAKVRAYFSQKVFMEDLSITNGVVLPCPGRAVAISYRESVIFSECLMLTQFISSQKKFIDCDIKISAGQLLDALNDGYVGFIKYTSKVFGSFLRVLLQDVEYKNISHLNTRIRELAIDDNAVSELCRALLIGRTDLGDERDYLKLRRRHKVVNSTEEDASSLTETEHDEEGQNDRESPDGILDMSQLEMQEESKLLLDRFSAEKELWELSPEDQLLIARHLLYRILDLESYKVETTFPFCISRDYISQDGWTEEAKSLMEKIKKQTLQIDSWREEVAELPEINSHDNDCSLPRDKARGIVEKQKQRIYLERKIDDGEDKLEELLEKLSIEKRKQTQLKRILPIGQDRHFRSYYWFPLGNSDPGLWVQDVGILNSSERWYRITEVDMLNKLVDSLSKTGIREGKLKSFIIKNMDDIVRTIDYANKERSRTPALEGDSDKDRNDFPRDPLAALKQTILMLASDLKDSYLTTIASFSTFETLLTTSDTLADVKERLAELADSIPQSAIITKLQMKKAVETGSFSWLKMERWKQRLTECQNASAVHVLRNYLDSRIDWQKSIIEKRCQTCGSRRNREAKIACHNCGRVVHYYCTRPKLSERPSIWTCMYCLRVQAKKKAEMEKTKEQIPDEDNEIGRDERDDDSEVDSDADDYFAEKECSQILEKVKATSRLYRSLQNIPVPRSSRRASLPSLQMIEDELYKYDSVHAFTTDLATFMKYAWSYLEEHNERKLSELEQLLLNLDLDTKEIKEK
uniref:PHD-type domain-containing protein n=1 Tax=Heterorhabditis bacteriophora TaxID=37862 RepID=A0A1I7XJ38_HETBA